MHIIRMILSSILLFLDRLFSARAEVKRTPDQQRVVDEACKAFAIYEFTGCPFCIKVRRAVRRLDLKIELRACEQGPFREELIREGGELQVPCLKITNADKTRWMYESNDIIAYLESQFRMTSSV